MRDQFWSIGLHGGAGAMRSMTADKEHIYRQELRRAILAGAALLGDGSSAVNAVIAAVSSMERSGAFNAGVGCCLNLDGEVQADAAVMSGADLSVGALAAVPHLGNAIELAELIRLRSPHCMLAGPGALRFAQHHGLSCVDAHPEPPRYERYLKLLAARGGELPEHAEALTLLGGTHDDGDTVGAVALDLHGNLAVAVSTGGVWLKHPGRVGDSPLPGAGFWAEDGVGACTATGTGEFIIRALLCQNAIERCRRGLSASDSADAALSLLTDRFGWGKAGLVFIDAEGQLAFPFHTQGMGRAAMNARSHEPIVAVWPEDAFSFNH